VEGAKTPLMLVPGLLCDERLWWHQAEYLREIVEPVVADVTRGASVSEMAHAVLEGAPAEHFALAGLSMGGYVALEIMRVAPERVRRLALLDTTARADTPEQTEGRRQLMGLAREGRFREVPRRLLPKIVHPNRLEDERLVSTVIAMAEAVGAEAFVRQERAIIGRPDSRGDLAGISCPTLVLCGREDALMPVHLHEEMASLISNSWLQGSRSAATSRRSNVRRRLLPHCAGGSRWTDTASLHRNHPSAQSGQVRPPMRGAWCDYRVEVLRTRFPYLCADNVHGQPPTNQPR
jgi:pimeloyl-ACP methyl ester carboxylesterase